MTISCIKTVIHHLEHLPNAIPGYLVGNTDSKDYYCYYPLHHYHFASTQKEMFFRKFAYIKDNYTEQSTKLCTKAQ